MRRNDAGRFKYARSDEYSDAGSAEQPNTKAQAILVLYCPQRSSIKIHRSDLPELRTDLVAALAALDVHELTHLSKLPSLE